MISRLIGFYATQVRVLWEWQGGRLALLRRLIVTLLVSTAAFEATDWIMGPRFEVDRVIDAAFAVILMALFNAIIRPVVLVLVAPISLLLVAVMVLVLQVVAFLVVANYAPGVQVDGFLAALIASFVYAIINTILTAILGIDRGGSYYGLLVQRLMVRRSTGHSDKPGLVIIQIDGLAHPILAARMRAGSVNTMASWVRDGSHKLSRWEAILPSMTSGSQAGILHGNNDGIPAFRWYERDRQHLMVSSSPVDAALIVSRISNGEGLLSNNGASICNLLSGDATRAYFTTAVIKTEGGGLGDSNAFMGFFFSPTGYLRSFTLFLGEFFKEMIQARRTRRSGIRPQMHRGLKYAGMRAASNVLLRDVNTAIIIDEMYRGTNVIYADFTDYDELAHHCGPERVESLAGARRGRSAIAIPGQGHRRGAAAVQVRRPLGPRPEPRRDVPAAIRRQPGRVRPEPDERPGDAGRDQDAGRGLDLRELVPVGDHPGQGRRADGGARRPGRQDDRWRRQSR